MATVADRIVARLCDAGVRHLFGMPGGGGNLDLIDAARRAEVPFVLTATENGGALAAVAQAEISLRPAACLTTLGPGAASVANGVACARLDRAPLIVFTDSHPASAIDCEHQRLDHRALLSPITKWSATLSADCAEQMVADALACAIAAPPGPVHLDCPGGVLSDAARIVESRERAPREIARQDLAASARLLKHARKPLVLVGLGARTAPAAAAIRALLERRGIPALVTYKAKGVVPDDHPWFAGVFTNGTLERPLLEQADLLIGVGLDPIELIPRPWTFAAPVVSCAAWTMSDRHVPFASQWVGDLADILPELERMIGTSSWDRRLVVGAAAAARERVLAAPGGFSPQAVVSAAAGALSGTARVAVDAGAHMFAATIGWPVSEPNQMLISNGLSTMGFALPAAIGAALADRGKPVVALTGDGGLMMCVSELATAARERLPIIVIVFADGALSLIEVKQQQRRLPADGVRLGPACWATIAEGFGAAGFTATCERELARAIEGALGHSGPSVIEAKIDATSYGRMLEAVRG